jgi:hypothetical protein
MTHGFSVFSQLTVQHSYGATVCDVAELNHVNLGQPSATLGAAGFGTIRGINGDPRIMQMVLKFAF